MAAQNYALHPPGDDDGGIRVSVAPSQAAYFAGEPFSVTVSFTNTRLPDSIYPSSARTASFGHSHKRGAHSISSAPMAKPPTSPGTPKSAQSFSASLAKPEEVETTLPRRGLIGGPSKRKPSPLAAEISSSKRNARSQSVTITPQDLINRLADEQPPHAPVPRRAVQNKPVLITPRTTSITVPPSHPHARKNSLQENLAVPEASFSLSLDPIRETTSPQPAATPAIPSPHPDAPPYFDIRTATHHADPSTNGYGLGMGLPPSTSAKLNPPRSAFSSTFSPPGTELLLWAHAQLSGTVEFDEDLVKPGAIDDLREKLRQSRVVGGGSMDMTAMSSPRSRGGFLSALLSPPLPSLPASKTRGHRSTPSLLSGVSSLFTASPEQSAEDATILPTLEIQPSMLVVDLSLLPGETRSYTYRVSLPSVLPPTFRGRAARFSYHFVVGTCRSTPGGGPDRQRSRVMRIPIRVYNHVSVTRPQRPYDLLWPVARRRDRASLISIEEVVAHKETARRQLTPEGSIESLEFYARRLLALNRDQPALISSSDATESILGIHSHLAEDVNDITSCRESVEILTRNPKRVSYDVNKNGDKVAILTFVKSAYRLGETVLGVVELNERAGNTRVLQFSAMLEAHEIIPTALQPASKSRSLLKRIHAEYHSSLITDVSRMTFALDIPSDASPGFHLEDQGGLSWKVRICLLVSALSPGADVRHLGRDGGDGEWGTAWRATGSIAPQQRMPVSSHHSPGGWTSIFSSPFLGDALDDEDEDEDDPGVWEEAKVETVECEVPIQVWPGNTAFRAIDIVFDV